VLNFMIASTVACSAVIISMIVLSDVASVVVLGLAYGYFSGVCMCHTTACVIPATDFKRHCAVGTVGDCVHARFVWARVGLLLCIHSSDVDPNMQSANGDIFCLHWYVPSSSISELLTVHKWPAFGGLLSE
jgi:hypothetical protein